METLIGLVATGSSAGGRVGRVFKYLRYMALLFTIFSFVKKMFFTADPDELKLVPDEYLIPKPSGLRARLSYRIMKAQFKSKGMALKDYGKSVERREYEQSLDLVPTTGKERFLIHPKPEFEDKNITAWVYDAEKNEKIFSYEEPVPTIEYIKYMNSFDAPQIVMPAWKKDDLVDFSYYITAYPTLDISTDTSGYEIVHGAIENINLQKSENINLQDFDFKLPQDSKDLYLHGYMRRSNCFVAEFEDDDTCTVVSNKTIKLTYTDSETGKTYYHPLFAISLSYNKDDLMLSQVSDYFKPHIIQDDFTGRRDNSSAVAVRYFPYIEYDSIWERKSELIEISENSEKIHFGVKVETTNYMKLQVRLKVVNFLLEKYLSLPFTSVNSLRDFEFQLDNFKASILDYSTTVRYFSIAIVAVQAVCSLLGFTYEAPINGSINATSHLVVAGLQIIILTYLFAENKSTSIMVLASTVVTFFVNIIKANELYDKTLYEKNEVKPTKFKASQKFSEKTMIFQEKYPKALTYIEPEFEAYRANVALPALIKYVAPLTVAYTGYVAQRDGFSIFKSIITVLAGISYGVAILNDIFVVYQNYKLKEIAPYSKTLNNFKLVFALINLLFVGVANMPLFHVLYSLTPVVTYFVYVYQTSIYKNIEVKINTESLVEKAKTEAKIEAKKKYKKSTEKKVSLENTKPTEETKKF